MLERIAEIKGVGLLHDANGKPHSCAKATLIYADNGRGKTTLASILQSAATGDAKLITDRTTVDGTLPPKVVLHFASGHKVYFNNGSWSQQRPELLVFDADFIERNVHSGGTVNTGHRKNLLEFALGESAVAARKVVEKTTEDAKSAAEKTQGVVAQLSGHHAGMALAEFETLQRVDDADTKLLELQKRNNAASNIAAILGKTVPAVIVEPMLNIDSTFVVFATSLKDVHLNAEKIVRQHIASLGNKSAEIWLSQGRQFDDGKSCPYCGQGTSENDLISAYQTHFDAAYNNLKATVTASLGIVASSTASRIVELFAHAAKTSAAYAAAWIEHVTIEPILFDAEAARSALSELQALLLRLSQQKLASPAEAVGGTTERDQAIALWEKVVAPMRATNLEIRAANESISVYKGKLAADNVQQLQQQMQLLQVTIRRYDPPVVALFAQLISMRNETVATEKDKKNARENLDALMKTTLEKYENDINALLRKFGVAFTIQGMGGNFRGAAPRSEYGLLLRGKTVSVDGGPPFFATALSEGDKRTLAFAFFIASTLSDAKLATRIVVIDDPMCSLDINRKHHTRTVLRKIYTNAEQLIVLAHDIHFVRDLRDALRKEDKVAQIEIFQLTFAANDYTGFAHLDIDTKCESAYFQHHRLLNDFVAGKGNDVMAVAKAIRPMLEGYLHRRFPGLVPKSLLFGEVVIRIRDAVAPSPLRHAQDLVTELNEINDYAGQFHHDKPSADSASQLKTFVNRAISLVHKGSVI